MDAQDHPDPDGLPAPAEPVRATGSSGAGVVVCGTGSGVGKSVLVAGLCRSLARRGVSVAPFKAQNMSNNSSVTVDGGEIGRAQFAQARAAGVDPTTAMNPVLLKPTSDRRCDVIVRGRLLGRSDASAYGEWTEQLRPMVIAAFHEVAAAHEVVVCEGAGGAAEINLLHRDLVNLPFARDAGLPAVVVTDIDRGGAFSGLFGAWAIVPDDLRSTIRGFVINRFRGDPTLLRTGIDELERRTGVPVLGVVPWLEGPIFDEEDSEFRPESHPPDVRLDVAVVQLPRVANTSDVDPLVAEPGVRVRWVASADDLGEPDLVVLPGSKSTVADLSWLRSTGLADALAWTDADVVGICAGYQMLGERIVDDVEATDADVAGLGALPVTTRFEPDKVVRRRAGTIDGHPVDGYEIRHGRPDARPDAGWLDLDDGHGAEREGATSADGRVRGTSLHGLFGADGFRRAFLADLAHRRGRDWQPGAATYAEVLARRDDRLADHLEHHLDLGRLGALAAFPVTRT
jgi:adenosylcobyric acid synthase